VIVQEINIVEFSIRETKNNAPIRPHRHRPIPLQVTPQWMQSITCQIQFLQTARQAQGIQQDANAVQHFGRQFPAFTPMVKAFQTFVPETENHELYCNMSRDMLQYPNES
jgi:trehalose-6-phosphate synthase